MLDLVIKAGLLVTPEGTRRADLGIEGERIAQIAPDLAGREEIDAAGMVVLPGVIDAHTHMELPVRGDTSSDDFYSGTRAAACGGVTTISDFSVGAEETSIPDEVEARKEQANKAAVDYTLHGEVIGWKPGKEEQFAEATRLGVRTFKFYLTYSRSGRMSDDGTLYQAFHALSRCDGTAMVHAENDAIINALVDDCESRGDLGMESLARTRPALCEQEAVTRAAVLARYFGVRLRIAHVSSAIGLEAVRVARGSGCRIAAETCPQYLLLDRKVYEGKDGHMYAITPPLRGEDDRSALWGGLSGGEIDLVTTDHCPFTRKQKSWKGSFLDLPYGMAGVETLLPLVYSEAVSKGRVTLSHLARLLSSGPAKVLGIYPRKGALRIDSDADVVVVDPGKEVTLKADRLHMKTDFCPYEGMKVDGYPVMTVSRGRVVFSGGEFCGERGWGRFVPQSA